MSNFGSKKKEDRKPGRSHFARSWQLQEAKAKLSELIRLAQSEGPQLITHHGRGEVVVVPVKQFEQLTQRVNQPSSIVDFFARSPLVGVELDLERDKQEGRDIEL